MVSSSTSKCGVLTAPGLIPDGRTGFGPGSEEIEFAGDGSLWGVFEAGSLEFPGAPFFRVVARFDLETLTKGPSCSYTGT